VLVVVNYHYVRRTFDSPHPGIFGVTADAFVRQLELLGRAGEFVSLADILRAVRGEATLPSRSILVTFDDGLREQYEHGWSALERLHIPGVIFASTRPIDEAMVCTVHKIHLLRSMVAPDSLWALVRETAAGADMTLPQELDAKNMGRQYPFDSPAGAQLKYLLNFALSLSDRERLVDLCFDATFTGEEAAMSRELYLTRDQIRELAAHGAIGSHGHDHLPLALIGQAAAAESLRRSAELLREWSGVRPLSVAYPYGSREAVTHDVARAAEDAGYECGFTVESAGNDEAHISGSPLLLARFDCNYMPSGKLEQWTPEALFAGVPRSTWFSSGDPGRRHCA